MVWRPEDYAAHPALRDKSVFALGGFGRGAISLIKRAEMFLQHVCDPFILGQPEGVVQSANEQRLDGLSFGVLFDTEHHRMPLRLLQNHLRYLEQGVGTTRHFDLARQGFDTPFFWDQSHIDFRQGSGGFSTFARLRPVRATALVSLVPANPITTTLRPRRPSPVGAGTVPLATRSR
jgi:hypothetical protein